MIVESSRFAKLPRVGVSDRELIYNTAMQAKYCKWNFKNSR